jgi:fluoride ion exporter CrcB/FEX
VNEHLYLSLEIRKQTNALTDVSGLVEWQAAASIGFLAAINTTSNTFMMGLTKSVEKNKWGIIFNNHPQLGLSGNITVNHGLAK